MEKETLGSNGRYKWRSLSNNFCRRPPQTVRDSSNNLHYDKYISFSEAVLGTSTEIPTVNGKVKIKVEPGTQSGKTLRLKNKGVPSVEGYKTGDLLVHINVWTPQELTKEEKNSLRSVMTLKILCLTLKKQTNPFLIE